MTIVHGLSSCQLVMTRVLDQTYRISDAQALHIEVSIENGAYEIREWKSVSTGDWDPDQTIDVAK